MNQNITGINAIAVARSGSNPSNTEVLWLNTTTPTHPYEDVKIFDGTNWVLLSRTPDQLLIDLKTVDGKGSGLDADTLQGLTPAQLRVAAGATPALSTGELLVGQGDTIGTAQTIGGIATVNASGTLLYVNNSISHTGLSDIGVNTHVQIDSKLANIDNIDGNDATIGTLGAGQDGMALTWDNGTSKFILSAAGTNLATDDLVQDAEPRVYSAGFQNLTFGNIGVFTVGDTNPGGAYLSMERNVATQLKLGTASLLLSGSDTVNLENSLSRLKLEAPYTVTLDSDYGTTSNGGKFVLSAAGNVFTDHNTVKEGLKYNADYSASFTDRSLVDKAFVLANAGGDNISNADLTFDGDHTADLDGNNFRLLNGAVRRLDFGLDNNTGYGGNAVGDAGHSFYNPNNEGVIAEFLDDGGNVESFIVSQYGNIRTEQFGQTVFRSFRQSSISKLEMYNNGAKFFQVYSNNTSYLDGDIVLNGTAKIGTEDISLQGETYVGGMLEIVGTGTTNATETFKASGASVDVLIGRDNGEVNAPNLPTSATGLVAGDLWNNAGVLNIV
ncbi:hypothetical protein N9924_00090 [bacterium]|nr:hypothetical protein [bacterium]